MGRGGIRFGQVIFGALLTLIFVPAALADSNLGTVGGLTYIQDTVAMGAAPVSAIVQADCPAGTRVGGGGVAIGGTGDEDEVRVVSSFPFDDEDLNTRPDDGWEAVGLNFTGAGKSISAYAMCTTDTLAYVVNGERHGPGTGTALAECPQGKRVAAGGVRLTGNESNRFLNRSRPVDRGDNGSQPDDGWQARAHNDGAAGRIKAFAICGTRPMAYRSDTTDSSAFLFIYCPAATFGIGGGFTVSGAPTQSHIQGSDPFSATINPPSSGFVASYHQTFGPPKTLTGYAVCAR